jgi:hypothetical protein
MQVHLITDAMKISLLVSLILLSTGTVAQLYKSSGGEIRFFSEAPIENIEASSTEAGSIFDSGTGDIVFSIPMRSFQFDKSLMQTHFNDQYVESDKFPKSKFKGNIKGFDRNKPGKQQVTCSGEITIHGVTQNVGADGTIVFNSGTVEIESVFKLTVEDFDIEIPKLLWQNIAEVVEVSVLLEYKEL